MTILQLLQSFFESFFTSILNLPTILLLVILVLLFIKTNVEYKNSTYYQSTKTPLFALKRDAGKYGEYQIYKRLKSFEKLGAKFLFNTYIPKENDETAEIDVLMICSKGIFVFESKNYSGWIFGNEKQKNWYQTLPTGKGKSHKESFYNPVLQNRSHIKHLGAFLNQEFPLYSIIVFSERCTLKNIEMESTDIPVINRYDILSVVSKICNKNPNETLSESDINNIYNLLYPYTQVEDATKVQHIKNIQQKNEQNIKTEENCSPTTTETTDYSSVTPQENDNSPKLCPKCGSILVLRTAKRGTQVGQQFYGCSNFPKCRYIQNDEH